MRFDEIRFIAARCRNARRRRQTERILNSLPPEIQRDLDWCPPPSLTAKVFRWAMAAIRR